MKKDDIITLEDNVEYMVLDTAEINHEKYLFCVEIDEQEMPKTEYKYFKEIKENDDLFAEEVIDENSIEALTAMFAADYLNSVKDIEQEV